MPRRVYADLQDYFKHHAHGEMNRVAADVGCSHSFLSAILWGYRQPKLPLALKISQRCNVPLESLVLATDRKALAKELQSLGATS